MIDGVQSKEEKRTGKEREEDIEWLMEYRVKKRIEQERREEDKEWLMM